MESKVNSTGSQESKLCLFLIRLGFLRYFFLGGKVKNFFFKLYGPFLLWMGFNCLKATTTSRRQFNLYHSVPRNSWHSFYRPRKDERLSRPWSYPVVLITGPLDWESSALTIRPLLHLTPLSYLKKN